MKITALKQQVRNAERVSIFVDGKYTVSLTVSQLLEERIKVGDEIDERQLSSLKKKSADGKLRAKAMNWVFLRPRSVKELREYLKRANYPTRKTAEKVAISEDTAQLIIDEFTRRGWVDDAVFAKWWVERSSRKNKSLTYLRSELYSKGIDRDIVSEVLEANDETATLAQLVKTLSTKTKYQDKEKLMRYLMSKGFSYSSVVDALAEGREDSEG